MKEQVIKPTTLASFIKSLSGLFITKENPNGISPKELIVFITLVHLTHEVVDKDVKVMVSNSLNQTLQVTTNYVSKFKKKGLITKDNKIHPLFSKKRIVIEYEMDKQAD